MTPADALALAERSIRRGMCSPKQHAANGCQVCDDALAAIETLRARVALPVIATCGQCGWHHTRLSGPRCEHPAARDTVAAARSAPPAWCPLRGAP